jgi:hypothetical protein
VTTNYFLEYDKEFNVEHDNEIISLYILLVTYKTYQNFHLLSNDTGLKDFDLTVNKITLTTCISQIKFF